MAKIIVINGFPQSGKDLFCQYCQEILGYDSCAILSSVRFVKNIARECGWDGNKNAKNRKFLSDLKDLLTEWNDVPFEMTTNEFWGFYISSGHKGLDLDEIVAFIHVREPEEIQRYKNELGARTLLILRPAVENYIQSNHADSEVLDFNYDYVIYNDGTEEDLKNKANEFIINLLKEKWQSDDDMAFKKVKCKEPEHLECLGF